MPPLKGRGTAKNQGDRPAAGLNPATACYHTATQDKAAPNPKKLRPSVEDRHARTFFTARLDLEPRAVCPVALAVAASPPPVANGDCQEHAPAGQR